jgi:hypothetical protein
VTTSRNDHPERSFNEILLAFLEYPTDNLRFKAFFEHCRRRTFGCLYGLRRNGFRLPGAETTSAALQDLTYDILGSFLRTERGKRPFHVIFDYLKSRGINDPAKHPVEELARQFMILLRSFVRQEAFRITQQEDAQKANLRRRFTDVLSEEGYVSEKSPKDKWVYVYQAGQEDSLRLDRPLISFTRLQTLVETAYLETTSRSQWCVRIFLELAAIDSAQNRLRKNELVSAALSVSLRYLEAEAYQPLRLPTPEEDFGDGKMREACELTMLWLSDHVIKEFELKGRISEDEGERLAHAAELYLTDLCVHGNSDPLPEYFREVMPDCRHEKYLENYKYVFDTIIKRMVDDFRSRLK